eukprot:TRINITY_DN90888_c0_g1_i1.p1 TRINITY_DN90888_c0_g1~~TRINITY_DN90888_c0_g1_i1.p1  ORF type:complete len:483 (-),score=44.38 TRINITY_DN90888_c0_g1_i1:8-1456(-)
MAAATPAAGVRAWVAVLPILFCGGFGILCASISSSTTPSLDSPLPFFVAFGMAGSAVLTPVIMLARSDSKPLLFSSGPGSVFCLCLYDTKHGEIWLFVAAGLGVTFVVLFVHSLVQKCIVCFKACFKREEQPLLHENDTGNDSETDIEVMHETDPEVTPAMETSRYCCRCCCPKREEGLLLDEEDGDNCSDTALEVIPGMKVPKYWVNQDLNTHFDERHPTNITKELGQMLDKTFLAPSTRDRKGPMPHGLRLIKAMRVEDRRMWLKYLHMRQAIIGHRRLPCTPAESLGSADGGNSNNGAKPIQTMEAGSSKLQDRLDDRINEFYLWHGTSPHAAARISEDGFKIDLAGTKTGCMFGRGAYFAECSSKADEYAETDTGGIYEGIYALLLCRVVCGEMYYTSGPDKEKIENLIIARQYDSVLGDREMAVGTYREFVVFKGCQIYPEYTILYERVYDDHNSEYTDTSAGTSEADGLCSFPSSL